MFTMKKIVILFTVICYIKLVFCDGDDEKIKNYGPALLAKTPIVHRQCQMFSGSTDATIFDVSSGKVSDDPSIKRYTACIWLNLAIDSDYNLNVETLKSFLPTLGKSDEAAYVACHKEAKESDNNLGPTVLAVVSSSTDKYFPKNAKGPRRRLFTVPTDIEITAQSPQTSLVSTFSPAEYDFNGHVHAEWEQGHSGSHDMEVEVREEASSGRTSSHYPTTLLGNNTPGYPVADAPVVVVRVEEVLLVALVLIIWVAAIVLFFNRWGKIRMLEPYQPKFHQQPHRPSCPLAPLSPPGVTNQVSLSNSVTLSTRAQKQPIVRVLV